MASTQKPKVIVVLGMHRSGTSALTRSLSVLQTTLSTETIGATGNNPKGYWEDKDVVVINERLISVLATRWCDLLTITNSAIEALTAGEIFNQAVELVRSKLSTAPAWGVKDPRMCRLLPFWKKVFEEVGCEVTYILAIRNPVNVAASLYARDALALSHSYLLWGEHVASSLRETIQDQRIVVDYDILLSNPGQELIRIAQALHLPPPNVESKEFKEYSKEFLDPNLRHHAVDIDALQNHPYLPNFVKTLYIELLKAAKDTQILSCASISQAVSDASRELSASPSIVKALNSLVHENRSGLLEVSRLKTCLEKSRCHNAEQKAIIRDQRETLQQILSSKSWRIAAILQTIARYVKSFRKQVIAHE